MLDRDIKNRLISIIDLYLNNKDMFYFTYNEKNYYMSLSYSCKIEKAYQELRLVLIEKRDFGFSEDQIKILQEIYNHIEEITKKYR